MNRYNTLEGMIKQTREDRLKDLSDKLKDKKDGNGIVWEEKE